jgi:hypothetical protein
MFNKGNAYEYMSGSGKLAAEELTKVLAQANSFKLSSLEANRLGELSSEQIPKLYSRFFTSLVFIFVPLGVLIFQLSKGGFLSQFEFSLQRMVEVFGQIPKGLLIIGIILTLVAIMGLVQFALALVDLLNRTVRDVEGVGIRKMTTTTDDDGSETTRLFYVISGAQFKVSKKGFRVFEDGRQYRAYFTPLSRILVNIEVLE